MAEDREAVNPWRTEKIRRSRSVLQPIVEAIEGQFRNAGYDVYTCGSWRREVDLVGDLDVAIVTDGKLPLPQTWAIRRTVLTYDKVGDEMANTHLDMDDGELHIDFYATPRDQLGPMLLFLTGPQAFNIALRSVAKDKKMLLNQRGLFTLDGSRLDNATEESILDRLGGRWPKYLNPRARDAFAKITEVEETRTVTSDSGNTYTMERQGLRIRCTCMGYGYRNYCRHSDAWREELLQS